MTERCQTKFIEKFDNQNYIIYVGVISASLAVLYFYRFHFIAITLSYVLGCVACYYGLKSNVLRDYVRLLKSHFSGIADEGREDDVPVKGCVTCGSPDCARHNPGMPVDPWEGLQIHKQLDQAIEDFYNTILDQFINTWYSKITLQPFFVDELRYQLRYASASLLRRALKVDYPRVLTSRLVPCALRHYSVCAGAAPPAPHPAAASRAAELKYLRSVTRAIMPYLLKTDEAENP
ncbi:sorting nexin-14-like [Ostrinia nubilalis]|uniref:sorting nexin-14-like n=1 Tax=Ostrinia nubilalis TaxID=29057 RepID=UPI00308233F7